ncbi:fibronectin type III domain-containing protein [Candidatus Poribacteria bacterium]|jgi:hypothetical protein|nr:fibronectin type III domain-containing protein [Candidatus Poribacteria bacterium]MBT5535732.1 fibronectin type III domain-containing protein [Candidatus Poribacteria bacterium]MBT5712439.1 fibronectin type III domain-containing protein [Candidatus Poribacteria bacterium]MBT7804490.1 fibronectin type III domain-containing protein [Candidatus Poribacteria bacterium]
MHSASVRLRWSTGGVVTETGIWALGLLATLVFTGCFVDIDDTDESDWAPSEPRGVSSISGDGHVVVTWIANTEPDLEGYEVWRSRRPGDDFTRVATVGRRATDYLDTDVRNGNTYYYALLAFDESGNESPLSEEDVEDTPRPEGRNVTLADFLVDPGSAGFAFALADRGSTHWDRDGDDFLDRSVDVFFRWDDDLSAPLMQSDHEDLLMQDLGFHEDMTAVDVAPAEGYTFFWTELIEGHVYAFFTPDGHYAKIRVTRVSDESVTFDWAYQEQPLNTDLAPSANPIVLVARRPRR